MRISWRRALHPPKRLRDGRIDLPTRTGSCRIGFEMKSVVLILLRAYKRFISPLLPSSCIYQPTCSEYMMQAVQRYGVIKGVWLGIKRIARCHPFAQGGYDPVP